MRSFVLAAIFATASLGASAEAASHQINIAPVQKFVQDKLVNAKTNRLKLTTKLNVQKPGAGVTAKAVTKAVQTLNGMKGFNSGRTVGNYVVKMGNEKLLVTAMSKAQKIDGIGYESTNPGQLFVVRTAKNGLVIARGILDQTTGKLSFTRSHNALSPSTPAERNAATK